MTPPIMKSLDASLAGTKKARVEIIPLIDVIFFLLATFVLFTLTLHRVRVFEAELPQGTEKPGVDDTTAFIQASADGTFHWKVGSENASEPITIAELPMRLASYKQSVRVPRVLVRSDDKAKISAAVAILDEVNRAEIKQVAIETRMSAPGS
jgi:biopolymer transport protein ExbD